MTQAKITRELDLEIQGALQYGAEVAIKLKDDYGVSLTKLIATRSTWLVLADEYEARVDASQAAFMVANHIQGA